MDGKILWSFADFLNLRDFEVELSACLSDL